MRISGINWESIVDGDGVRVVVYLQGCNHKCKGCHNPSTHDFNGGQEFTLELQRQVIDYIKNTPYIKGITFSGGDPIYQLKELVDYMQWLKEEIPNINIWVYTGFEYENIKDLFIKFPNLIDVLVDGKFIQELYNADLHWKGSSNQRVIDIKKTLASNKIILLNN